MRAAQIVGYGPPSVIQVANIPRPQPHSGQLLVRVKAAGVGPWDALVREGRTAIPQTLPLTLGSDIAGTVEAMGADVSGFAVGNEVYGLTNNQFTGGYAEHAVASASSMAGKPRSLNFVEAASAPVVAVTAWQMLFDTVGGDTRMRSLGVLKSGGILVSVVPTPIPSEVAAKAGVRVIHFIVDVTTARLNQITELFDSGKLVTDVGTVLPLERARVAHEMLEGAPHKRGKIVLSVNA